MMKKIMWLLPLFLGACSNSGESPVIKIEKLYVKAESDSDSTTEEDYANKMEELPVLKEGDEVKALLLLDGNGSELKTFTFQKDDNKALTTHLVYEKSEVSTEGNLTNEKNGQLRFKDGVTTTRVMVQATVSQVDKNGDVRLKFYLSSKAECEGAQEEIGLKTKVDDEEE
ncbi:DUF5035 domain-containing protein [uncultured Bacteroides sp.]|uniref:DUF5035 domain-containing protein n=1 Tax=uncultured Bacteroides sp. TaxID=162156 RepID=UPI0025CE5ADB|nr:DUF5035 domain-containing protein [uncultured Bacteroides sp.]